MHDSMYIKVFYGFVELNTQPNVHWFYDKINSLKYFFYEFLEQIEDIL